MQYCRGCLVLNHDTCTRRRWKRNVCQNTKDVNCNTPEIYSIARSHQGLFRMMQKHRWRRNEQLRSWIKFVASVQYGFSFIDHLRWETCEPINVFLRKIFFSVEYSSACTFKDYQCAPNNDSLRAPTAHQVMMLTWHSVFSNGQLDSARIETTEREDFCTCLFREFDQTACLSRVMDHQWSSEFRPPQWFQRRIPPHTDISWSCLSPFGRCNLFFSMHMDVESFASTLSTD